MMALFIVLPKHAKLESNSTLAYNYKKERKLLLVKIKAFLAIAAMPIVNICAGRDVQ